MPSHIGVLTRVAKAGVAGAVLLGSAAVSYVGISAWREAPGPDEPLANAAAADDGAAVNPFASANGTHLIAFVITASDCGWSTLPATMRALGGLRTALRTAYGDSYARVTVVGVALDQDLKAGTRFLAKIGKGSLERAFDQVVVGGDWLNEQMVRFAWREGRAQAATPQVILIERPVNTESYLSHATIAVQDDRHLFNVNGSVEIVQWLNVGTPLDRAWLTTHSLLGLDSLRGVVVPPNSSN